MYTDICNRYEMQPAAKFYRTTVTIIIIIIIIIINSSNNRSNWDHFKVI